MDFRGRCGLRDLATKAMQEDPIVYRSFGNLSVSASSNHEVA